MNIDRTIIIPAAGRAARFNGIPKELLPIAPNLTCLQSAVRLAESVGSPLVVTSPAKRELHANLLPGVEMVVQDAGSPPELWGAIMLGVRKVGVRASGIILADTVTTFLPEAIGGEALSFGLFETETPERFSVLSCGRIWTKRVGATKALAWGVVMWGEEVSQFFLAHGSEFTHYDDAFNAALVRFGHGTFSLTFYHDLGSWQHYRQYLLTTANIA